MDFLLDVLDSAVNRGFRHAQLHGDFNPGVVFDAEVKDLHLLRRKVADLPEERTLQLRELCADIQGLSLLPLRHVAGLFVILLALDPGSLGLPVPPDLCRYSRHLECHLRHPPEQDSRCQNRLRCPQQKCRT